MLKYLWMGTQDLILAVTWVSCMHALLFRLAGPRARRIHGWAVGIGTLASIVLAIVKYNTHYIISSRWNHYIYAVILVLTVGFMLLALVKKRDTGGRMGARDALLAAFGSAHSAVLIFYSLPSVLLYPFSFNTMGQGYLSAYYMTRLAGWAAALLLMLVYSSLLYRCALHIQSAGRLIALMDAGLIVNAVYCFGRYFVPWVNRAKWLKWPVKYSQEAYGWAGDLMMFTANYSMLFHWIQMGLAALLAVLVFAENLKVTKPYANSAQHRKLKAINRSHRRISAATLACLALSLVILTVVKLNDTKVVTLSAPENYTVEGDKILVPMEFVNDGHLHRFEYTTDNGISVRWIVVKKPNSATYGVGLDACEVCGNAGYFERGGQIVCKRCDVVMNINTIGFKGGCNPIPMPYEVGDGNLVFKISDIEAGEKEFK